MIYFARVANMGTELAANTPQKLLLANNSLALNIASVHRFFDHETVEFVDLSGAVFIHQTRLRNRK